METSPTKLENQTHKSHIFIRNSRLTVELSTALLLSLLLIIIPGPAFAQHGHAHGNGHSHGDKHSQSSQQMEELTVTADRMDEYVENYPNQVVVMDAEEISGRNLLSVAEALQSMPGVEVKKSTGMGSRISIRGSGKSGGVLVLLNGRPLNSSQYGAVDLATIPIETIQSITVFKPPVPVWIGGGASDGAINIVTRGLMLKKEKKGRNTQIRAAGGSYGLVEGNLSHRVNLDAGAFMATAGGTHKDGKRTNSDRDSGNASIHWDRKFANEQTVEIDGRCYASEHGSAGPYDNPTPDARQEYLKYSLDSRFNGLIADAGDYGLNFYADMVDLTDDAQSGLSSTLDSVKWGVKGENNWYDQENIWEFRLSAIVEREEVDHSFSGAHHRVTTGFGAQIDRRWQSFTATLGGRGDYSSDFDLNPGFSAGLSYAFRQHWLAKVNTGYSINIPTFNQLYQPSHGSYDQVRGNPDLDEEKVWSYDAGLEYRPDKRRLFQITFFRSDTSDPIMHQRGTDLIYRPVNGDNAFRQGIEANVKYGFLMGMSMDLDMIVQNSQFCDTEKELPYTPRYKLSGTLQYALPGLNTRLETTLRYTSEQYSESENHADEKLDDYFTMDVKAVQPFKIKTKAAEWFLAIENLFDTDFEIHYGYPDDGIRFVSGFNLTI